MDRIMRETHQEYNRAKLQALDVDSIYKLEAAKAKKNKYRNASIRESCRIEKKSEKRKWWKR